MNTLFKPLAALGLMAAAVFAVPTTAPADEVETFTVILAHGEEGRGYHRNTVEFAKRLDGKKVKIDGVRMVMETELEETAGSGDITELLCDEDAHGGYSQVDAAMDADCGLQIAADYPGGKEHTIILFPPDSSLNALQDLGDEHRVLVGELGGGTELFWRNIVRIEKGPTADGTEWASATPDYRFHMQANALYKDKAQPIHAVVFVGDANSAEIHTLMGQGWNPGEFYDGDIDDTGIYGRESVTIDPPGAMNSDSEDAYVVPSFLYVSAETYENTKLFKKILKAGVAHAAGS